MERIKTDGLLLIIAGAVLGVVSAKADTLGLGVPGYSWEQGLGTFMGALGVIYGTYLLRLDGRLLVLLGLAIVGLAMIPDIVGASAPGIQCPQGIAIFVGAAVFLMGVNALKTQS